MQTLLAILLLLVGFVLLIKGADIFVEASVGIAKKLKIPNVVIALTIIAMGTSAPEVMISVTAAVNGSTSLAVGNVVGSNLFNLLFIIGLCAMLKAIPVRYKDIARDYWLSIVATVLLLGMMLLFAEAIPRLSSAVFLLIFAVYVIALVRQALKHRTEEQPPEKPEEAEKKPRPLWRNILFALAGVVLIVVGGDLTVDNAVNIAHTIGMSERIVGLTIVAAGTSLPELITSLVACKKGQTDIAIGTVIGSNIFNILFVLGITGVVMPLAIDPSLVLDVVILTAGSLAFIVFVGTGQRVVRAEGFVMVAIYAVYMTSAVLMS